MCETHTSEGEEDADEEIKESSDFMNNNRLSRPPRSQPRPIPKPHPRASPAHLSSQLSVISDTTAEELCYMRDYYHRQLRRIHYMSQEHLGQARERGALGCLSEPFRSVLLPCTVRQSARSLWSRLSTRKKIF